MPILINPMNEHTSPPKTPAPRLETLEGKRVVLLDISKPGGSVLLDRLEILLRQQYNAAEVIREKKPTFAKPAPGSVIDHILAARPHAVIEALAD